MLLFAIIGCMEYGLIDKGLGENLGGDYETPSEPKVFGDELSEEETVIDEEEVEEPIIEEEEILENICDTYGVTFPMLSKVEVQGDDAHPLFVWLQDKVEEEIEWNFNKFLVDSDGNVVIHLDST